MKPFSSFRLEQVKSKAARLILDIGCGHLPKGDVNVDRFIEATSHRSQDQRKRDDQPLDAGRIPNLICADACHLPFKNNTFETVYSSHTLEHTNGSKMFSEAVRVSRKEITIICPNQVGCRGKKTLHKYPVNLTWFHKAARHFQLIIQELKYSGYQCFPHRYIPLIRIPNEITFRGRKQ